MAEAVHEPEPEPEEEALRVDLAVEGDEAAAPVEMARRDTPHTT